MIRCARESLYYLTVLRLWRSRDDIEWPSFLSLCCGSFCSSGAGGADAHLEYNCFDLKRVGGSKRGSEKLGLVAWLHDFDWANTHFVYREG
jgi:hypothetical protein